MSTKAQILILDGSRTVQDECLDDVRRPVKFTFDVTLSTAVTANGISQVEIPDPKGPLTPDLLDKMNRYWRAANYLCIGQIYLLQIPLLREPLKAEQLTPRLLGN